MTGFSSDPTEKIIAELDLRTQNCTFVLNPKLKTITFLRFQILSVFSESEAGNKII